MAPAVRPVRCQRPLGRRARRHTAAPGRRFLADRGIDLRGGTVTALLQARVLGYVFNPLSLFWCHDADGVLRHVVAEVHNTYGGSTPTCCPRRGAARDGDEEALRFTFQRSRRLLPGEGAAAGFRTRRDDFAAPREPTRIRRDDAWGRRPAGIRQILRLQLVAPMAPLMGRWGFASRASHCGYAGSQLSRGRRSPRRKGSTNCDYRYRPASSDIRQRGAMAGCARVPSGPLSRVGAPIADRLFRSAAAQLPLRMVIPTARWSVRPTRRCRQWWSTEPDRLARRVGRYGLIGFGESYMAGEWSSDDLAGVLTEFASSVGRPDSALVAAASPDRRCPPTTFAAQQPRAGPAQHRGALRPLE